MQSVIRLLLLLVLTALLVSTTVTAKSLPNNAGLRRVRRQVGDYVVGEQLARLNLQQRLNPHACTEVGCGLDFVASGKKKRSDDYVDADETNYLVRRRELIRRVLAALEDKRTPEDLL